MQLGCDNCTTPQIVWIYLQRMLRLPVLGCQIASWIIDLLIMLLLSYYIHHNIKWIAKLSVLIDFDVLCPIFYYTLTYCLFPDWFISNQCIINQMLWLVSTVTINEIHELTYFTTVAFLFFVGIVQFLLYTLYHFRSLLKGTSVCISLPLFNVTAGKKSCLFAKTWS